MLNHLANNCAEASHVQFVNCDGGECELLDAYDQPDDSWQFQSHGPATADMWDQHSSVVYMEMNDTE